MKSAALDGSHDCERFAVMTQTQAFPKMGRCPRQHRSSVRPVSQLSRPVLPSFARRSALRKTAKTKLSPHPVRFAVFLKHNRFLEIQAKEEVPLLCCPTYLNPRSYERTSKSCSTAVP